MVAKCCIKRCTNEWYPGCQISFHRFPSNPQQRKEWCDILNTTTGLKNKKICSMHFKNEDFIIRGALIKLSNTALPLYLTPPFKLDPEREEEPSQHFEIPQTLDENQDAAEEEIEYKDVKLKCLDEDDKESIVSVDNYDESLNAVTDAELAIIPKSVPRCKCCLEGGEVKNLWAENYVNSEREVYGDMLNECFGLAWAKPLAKEPAEVICTSCVERLRSAVMFKKEVIASAQLMCAQMCGADIEIKEEGPDTQVEYLNCNDPEAECQTVTDQSASETDKPSDEQTNEQSPEEEMVPETTVNEQRPQISATKQIASSSNSLKRPIDTSDETTEDDQESEGIEPPKRQRISPQIEVEERREEIEMVEVDSDPKVLETGFKRKRVQRAVEAVRNDQMTISMAAQTFGVAKLIIASAMKKQLDGSNTDSPAARTEVDDYISDILRFSNATPIKCHSEHGYHCCFCAEAFKNPADLKLHNLDKHADRVMVDMPDGYIKLDITGLKCLYCEDDLKTATDLLNHIKMVHRRHMRVIVKCPIMSFKFDDNSLLKCVWCYRKFVSFEHLEEHMHYHFKVYECDKCKRGFIDKVSLIEHLDIHDGGSPFKCKFCEKSFRTQSSMQRHVSFTHVLQKIPKSKKKGKGKKNKNNTDSNKVIKQSKGSDNLDSNGNASAKTVELRRSSRKIVKRHFDCSTCSLRFDNEDDFNSHTELCQLTNPNQCDVCGLRFPKAEELEDHKLSHKFEDDGEDSD